MQSSPSTHLFPVSFELVKAVHLETIVSFSSLLSTLNEERTPPLCCWKENTLSLLHCVSFACLSVLLCSSWFSWLLTKSTFWRGLALFLKTQIWCASEFDIFLLRAQSNATLGKCGACWHSHSICRWRNRGGVSRSFYRAASMSKYQGEKAPQGMEFSVWWLSASHPAARVFRTFSTT